jgi:hypothetical protein
MLSQYGGIGRWILGGVTVDPPLTPWYTMAHFLRGARQFFALAASHAFAEIETE